MMVNYVGTIKWDILLLDNCCYKFNMCNKQYLLDIQSPNLKQEVFSFRSE